MTSTKKRAKRVERWTKEIIIRELKNLEQELGRSPKTRDDMSLVQGARELFGSWNDAKKVAGLGTYPRGPPEYVRARREMDRKRNEAEFLRAFDRPMTARQLADKLGWRFGKISRYIGRLKYADGTRIAKLWLRQSSRGGSRFGSHELFGSLAAVQVYYLQDSQSHRVALTDMLKKAIYKYPSKGKRAALTHHLKRELPSDIFGEVHKHYTRAETKEVVLGELPDELRGPTLEELREWWESDRWEANG